MPTVRSLLRDLDRLADAEALARHAFGGLTPSQIEALAARGRPVYTGKVRDVVTRGEQELDIVHSDRLTAFDRMIALVPFKGTILSAISAWWLAEARRVVPTHFLSAPHERVLRVKRTDPVRIEVVVRGHLAGSMMRAYQQGERHFCGAALPEGLAPYGALPAPIITPTTKAAAFEHDENAAPEELIARGVCSEAEWRRISAMALELFAFGRETLERRGWILVDTKYEIGRDQAGELIIIDEVHTPDSSRFWEKATYAQRLAKGDAPVMLDKENVRRWLLEQGFSGHGDVPAVPAKVLLELARTYLGVAEALLGRPLESRGTERELPLAVLD